MWAKIKAIFWGELIVLDEAANVALGTDASVPAAGNPHFTVSERLAEMRERGSKFGCVACKVLTWIGQRFGSTSTDHCASAMQGMPEDIPENG